MTAISGETRSARSQELLAVALGVLERDGLERLSVGEIARQAGIRTPSLYKHFAGKAEIELQLTELGFGLLTDVTRAALSAAGTAAPRREQIEAFAGAYRAFGLQHPQLYRLMTERPLPRDQLAPGTEAEAMRDYLTLVPDRDHARSYWAWAHGLLLLEIARRYPPDADLDAAWRVLVDTVAG